MCQARDKLSKGLIGLSVAWSRVETVLRREGVGLSTEIESRYSGWSFYLSASEPQRTGSQGGGLAPPGGLGPGQGQGDDFILDKWVKLTLRSLPAVTLWFLSSPLG